MPQRAQRTRARTPETVAPFGAAYLGVLVLVVMAAALVLVVGSLGAMPVVAAETDPPPEPTPSPSPEPTPWPMPDGLLGVDVSHWNNDPNFRKLSNQDVEFVFSKATQGTTIVDKTYRQNTLDARANGVLTGAYHFFDYNKSGRNQARHFLDTVRKKTGLDDLLPLAVDVETLKSLGTPDTTLAKTRLHALLDELYRQTGRYPLIYTSRYMWDKVISASKGFAQYPLWVACWECDNVHLPRGWGDWTFWQAGQFKFSGGATYDVNVYAANMAGLLQEQQRDLQLAGGAPWTVRRAVRADLRGYDGKDVRYAVDDKPYGPWLPYQRRFELRLLPRQGQQDVRIQLRNFRGVKSSALRGTVGLDTKPPILTGPRITIAGGAQVRRDGSRIPVTARVKARDASAGLRSSTLKVVCGGKVLASKKQAARTTSLSVQSRRRGCTFIGRAVDVLDHRSSSKLEPTLRVRDIRKKSKRVTLSGEWTVLAKKDTLGKTIARSSSRGSSATLVFDGAQFAVVARSGPSGGRLKVIVDGKAIDTIDLYRKTGDNRRIVYVGDVTKGKHKVRLKATGTKSAPSSGTTVWLDAILVLDKRK